jgi:hypothetical protein
MKDSRKIKYLKSGNIDKAKWDQCVKEASNSRIYALSIYLDCMCSNWDALVAGDYHMVMPLPWRSKFGIHYLYQPAFSQQLGVFSVDEISTDDVEEFLKQIPTGFKYWDIALNAKNSTEKYHSRLGKNYLLPLSLPYDGLLEQYNRNAKRNIKKAVAAGNYVVENSAFTDTISLHRKRFNDSIGANDDDYKRLNQLLENLSAVGAVFSACIKNANGTIIASSTYLLHNNRIIFLLNGNIAESLKSGATHLLKDHVIKKFSATKMVMDFEGSDYPQFANFYEQFGAKEIESYPIIVNNKLPWPVKYLKRNSPAL